jgi:hypothetical protein
MSAFLMEAISYVVHFNKLNSQIVVTYHTLYNGLDADGVKPSQLVEIDIIY